MIRLDIDLSYLTKNFEIGTQRLNQYASKSIDEIMEAEAAQGNPQAEKFQQNHSGRFQDREAQASP